MKKNVFLCMVLLLLCFSFNLKAQEENGERGYFITKDTTQTHTNKDSLKLSNTKDSFGLPEKGFTKYEYNSSEYGRILVKTSDLGTFVLLNNWKWYRVGNSKLEVPPTIFVEETENGKVVFLNLMFVDKIEFIDLGELNKNNIKK